MTSTLVCVSIIIAAVLVAAAVARRERAAFEKRFPPISDAEFMARCRPGTSPQVALKVRRIVAHQLGVEYARVYPSTRFIEDLGVD